MTTPTCINCHKETDWPGFCSFDCLTMYRAKRYCRDENDMGIVIFCMPCMWKDEGDQPVTRCPSRTEPEGGLNNANVITTHQCKRTKGHPGKHILCIGDLEDPEYGLEWYD